MFFCIFTVCINWIYSAFTSCCVTYEKNFTAWSTMCVVWLLDPAFLMLRVRIENDSNSNSNQVLLNIYQVNILLSPWYYHKHSSSKLIFILKSWINYFNYHSHTRFMKSYSVSFLIPHLVSFSNLTPEGWSGSCIIT